MFDLNMKKLAPYLTRRNLIIVALFFLPMVLTVVVFFSDDRDEFVHMGEATYLPGSYQGHCASGSRAGESGDIYGESSEDGILYNVRTPLNYSATIPHPLLMVYAPAGANRARTEKLTNLTYEGTSAGFIVAYADHPELSTTNTVNLGKIPGEIAQKWCIDKNKIYLTGHSDGGTVSMALAFMAGTSHIPSAIAPSAAGISYRDLSNRDCPDPISVMVMHSVNDHLFPGYGEESLAWWAACNDCDPIPEKLENGCIAYPNCGNNTKVWYCEGDKLHAQWPTTNKTMIDFFVGEKGRDSKNNTDN